MGSINPDRVPLAYRRRRCETVGQMLSQQWDVHAKCAECGLLFRVDLRVVAKLKGAQFSLWNQRGRCRRLGCNGALIFQAKAPGMHWHEALDAPWPDGTEPQK